MEGYSNQPIPKEAAKQLLALDLEDKEILTYEKLDQWYTAWNGKCYVSFSGGKDSTVLAYLAARYLSSFRTPLWELNLVFVNTGLEYPEIQKFVNTYADWLRREFPRVTVNLHRLRPKMNIRQVVTKYGYSIVSKEVAAYVEEARVKPDGRSAARLRGEYLRSNGTPSDFNCQKWEYLLFAPFAISSRCCAVMKKQPMNGYARKTQRVPTMATMAQESRLRTKVWLKTGCNAFEGKHPAGKPMSSWTDQDVLAFLKDENIPYCSVYGDIVASDGENDYPSTLWERGVQPLEPTNIVEPTATWCPSGSYSHKHGEQHKGMFTTDRAKNRAKTFSGIAKAMAEQWGGDIRECEGRR